MKKTSLLLLIIFLLGVTETGCVQRRPSPKRSKVVMTRYFEKYAKKHKESDPGLFGIREVEIFEIRELQKNLVEVDAYLQLDKGGPRHAIRALLEKKALFWKQVSWENLGQP